MSAAVANEYDDTEVDAILQKALEAGDTQLGLSHEELADVAAQVGISTEQLEQAAEEVRRERKGLDDLAEAKAMVEKRRKRRRRGWMRHFFTYGIVIAGLAALDFVTGGGMTWWFYPAVGWGMGVALQAIGVLMYDEERDLERQLRRIRKHRERLEREARKKRSQGRPAGASLEEALGRGVALLLTTAAEKLASKMAAGTPPDTEFGRFVAKKRGVPTRVEAGRSGPGVRVSAEDESVEVEAAALRRQREAER